MPFPFNVPAPVAQMGQRVGGLLDPSSPRWQELAANPMFNVGMGILGANLDPRQNVIQGAMAGLRTARETQAEQEERERLEELRRQLGELLRGQTPGQVPGQPRAGAAGTAPPAQSLSYVSPLRQMPGSLTNQMVRDLTMGNLAQRLTGGRYG